MQPSKTDIAIVAWLGQKEHRVTTE